MPELPPLTPQLLQQYADDQAEVESGLSDDCAQLEDILVRLAGPTLAEIEADTNALMEIQSRLAEPALEGIKRDMQRITRMMRKLFTPTDHGIAEDTTLLTGIAARAQGSTFRHERRGPPHHRGNPGSVEVGSGATHSPTRPARPPNGAAGMGLPGTAPYSITGGAPGYPGHGPSPIPSLPGATNPPSGIPTGLGAGSSLEELAAQEVPPTVSPPAPAPQYGQQIGPALEMGPITVPGVPILTPTPSGAGAPTMPSPVGKPPSSGGLGSASPIPTLPPLPAIPPPPAPPVPPEPPPAPEPPAPGCDLCEVAEYLGQILRDGLACICEAIRHLTPGVQAQAELAAAQFGGADTMPERTWVDPPNQQLTDRDGEGVYDHPEILSAESALLIGGGIGQIGG